MSNDDADILAIIEKRKIERQAEKEALARKEQTKLTTVPAKAERTVEMWNALKKRKTHSEAFKKRLVSEALEEGKSVAMVAWLNHLPAPQLHKWVLKYGVES